MNIMTAIFFHADTRENGIFWISNVDVTHVTRESPCCGWTHVVQNVKHMYMYVKQSAVHLITGCKQMQLLHFFYILSSFWKYQYVHVHVHVYRWLRGHGWNGLWLVNGARTALHHCYVYFKVCEFVNCQSTELTYAVSHVWPAIHFSRSKERADFVSFFMHYQFGLLVNWIIHSI